MRRFGPAALFPAAFVVLWATGFVGARLAMPWIEPMTFLTIRFAIVLVLIGGFLLWRPRPWPHRPRLVLHLCVTGLLMHVAYLGGVFASIERGLPAGLSAVIIGLQPLLAAVAAGWLFGERLRPRQWLGFLLGLVGVATVLSERFDLAGSLAFDGFGLDAVAFAVIGLAGITAGTLYQKRFGGGMDLLTGTMIQYAAAAVVVGLLALLTETGRIVWTLDLWIALGWSVFGLSLAAVFLLMVMIRRGEAYRTASLFYLVPPVAAGMAYLLFDERLGPIGLAGTAVVVLGVALVVIRRRPRNGPPREEPSCRASPPT